MSDYPLERAPLSVCPDCDDLHRNSHTLCLRCERRRLKALEVKFNYQTARQDAPDVQQDTPSSQGDQV